MFQTSSIIRRPAVALAVALAAGVAAHAQSSAIPPSGASGMSSAYDTNRTSWIPYTHSGYVGLNVGRSNYNTSCGALALRCDDSDTSARIYLGGYFNPYFGAEVGYMDLGDNARGGGRTSAQGVNLSLVGRLPVAERFSLYGKLGTTYGRTRVSAVAGSGIVTGRESGWGAAYALGVNFDLTNNVSAVLEVDRQRFDFPGNTNDWVRATSIGLQYRF